MIGIVVPAHNEEAHLPACLKALKDASRHVGLLGVKVCIIVVLDACDDGSARVARQRGVKCVSISARNVGLARATGAAECIAAGARWLSFTDADTVVSTSWLTDQLLLQSDAVCGSVGVTDWSHHPVEVRRRYDARYEDRDRHRHIHGANFGVSTAAYVAAGGFPALTSIEDVALVAALSATRARIAWSSRPRVATSTRRDGRAPDGFAAHLMSLHAASASSA